MTKPRSEAVAHQRVGPFSTIVIPEFLSEGQFMTVSLPEIAAAGFYSAITFVAHVSFLRFYSPEGKNRHHCFSSSLARLKAGLQSLPYSPGRPERVSKPPRPTALLPLKLHGHFAASSHAS